MKNQKKIRIMVLYGGRSGEHEISLRSAASVIEFLDPHRFEVLPVLIDKEGKWHLKSKNLSHPVLLLPYPVDRKAHFFYLETPGRREAIDVVFPVMHGPLCEDGTIQGLLELADVPYVGSGVLASAIGMDKVIAKKLAKSAGIPVVRSITVKKCQWQAEPRLASRIDKELGYPVFVKPANLGSSVGVHKVKQAEQLEEALKDAFRYDFKILIEKAVNAREIEFAVLEDSKLGNPPLVSAPGEVISQHEFYSYEAKYLDEKGAKLLIPAPLSPSQIVTAQQIARGAFEILECEGMARVDLFLDQDSGDFYFNEVNTLPGFTSISMYPKMWEYSGIPYRELLSHLVDLAIARQVRKKDLVRDYHC